MMFSKQFSLELVNKLSQRNIIILYDSDDIKLLLMIAKKCKVCKSKIEIWVKGKIGDDINIVRQFSADDFEKIKKFYYMYEFTDQIIVLSDDNNYPSMMNYIRQGILSEDEMIEALLYKISGESL